MTVGRITFGARRAPGGRGAVQADLLEAIRERIAWLKQKEQEQRRVGGPDSTRNPLLLGRTQGAIGELERLERQLREVRTA